MLPWIDVPSCPSLTSHTQLQARWSNRRQHHSNSYYSRLIMWRHKQICWQICTDMSRLAARLLACWCLYIFMSHSWGDNSAWSDPTTSLCTTPRIWQSVLIDPVHLHACLLHRLLHVQY